MTLKKETLEKVYYGTKYNLLRTIDSRVIAVDEDFNMLDEISHVKSVITNEFDTTFIFTDDGLYGFGNNKYGVLGVNKKEEFVSKFTKVVLDKEIKRVEILNHSRTSFVITKDNCMYAAGDNTHGMCGLSDKYTYVFNFTKVDIAKDFIAECEICKVLGIVLLRNKKQKKLFFCGNLNTYNPIYTFHQIKNYNMINIIKFKHIIDGLFALDADGETVYVLTNEDNKYSFRIYTGKNKKTIINKIKRGY